MKIPILSKLNEKINRITCDLNSLGDNLVEILGQANKNISNSLFQSTEDIRKTSENIMTSATMINDSMKLAMEDISENADVMAESLTQSTVEIRETAQKIAASADSIAKAVGDFTSSTTETIDRFEGAIEKSIDRLITTIQDFKEEIVNGGIKVNIAKSASSLVPRPEGGFVQSITSGLRDIIIPKRKSKDDAE